MISFNPGDDSERRGLFFSFTDKKTEAGFESGLSSSRAGPSTAACTASGARWHGWLGSCLPAALGTEGLPRALSCGALWAMPGVLVCGEEECAPPAPWPPLPQLAPLGGGMTWRVPSASQHLAAQHCCSLASLRWAEACSWQSGCSARTLSHCF